MIHLSSLLKDYTAYNAWANAKYVEWLRKFPAERMQQELVSSFPTIHATMLHIWSAEKVWLERLKQEPTLSFLALTFQGSTEDIFKGWPACSAEFRDYIQVQNDDFFQEYCDYKLLNGNPGHTIRAEMIQHCIQHSTFHRGQILTLARQVGLTEPPATDYIVYTRQR